ncbi:NAD(P)/FAD-dependent oxidoreductase [Paenibacillus filicis]|uniref:NAD(P)/FAD-dependent oxidoreductase n=1 Tax=Paenibacillus gyeongsangnamensis TaxID=3388067 RepID=A0ABT4QC36_9BACL|nr:NAD(P)/FAD-dependent oxidoreductase [Paenibacillus filicis]MCZ8514452.1 NAD(P)/FAD-dependent oxidoreductase [Paenibacillus filicis]
MMFDCAIIGGGPAGLNAALVLGRARRNTVLFDNNRPRNVVTGESHGFITRDGVKPAEFRRIAHEDIDKYGTVRRVQTKIVDVRREGLFFRLATEEGEIVQARKLLLAAGLKETLPSVPGIHDFYGKSLFNCPYCDGWELRDRPLAVIAEQEHAFHMVRVVYNWSRDLVVFTNGRFNLSAEEKSRLSRKGIPVLEQRIASLRGQHGRLESVVLEDGREIRRAGGFVAPQWTQAAPFGDRLGCARNGKGGYVTDGFGRTSVKDVYAAGDTSVVAPSQLIIAAAEGSRAAIGVNTDLTEEDF